MRKKWSGVVGRVICGFWLTWLGAAGALAAQEYTVAAFEVRGQVKAPSGVSLPAEGLDVVLIKFVLSESGDVTPAGPQARTQTDAEGNFVFVNPPRDARAGYRLGTRFGDNLYSSDVFFMRAEQQRIVVNIDLPGQSFDTSQLTFTQSSLFFESNIGALIITEVISIENASTDNVLTTQTPLSMTLPAGHEQFQVLEEAPENYRKEGNTLRWTRLFAPGNNQLIFQYVLPVTFGSLDFSKTFSHSLDRVSVFTPKNRLELSSPQLTFQGTQDLSGTEFLAWQAQAGDAPELAIQITGVPVDSLNYIFIGVAVFLALCGATAYFFWNRLPRHVG
jgi:hypothetical protein